MQLLVITSETGAVGDGRVAEALLESGLTHLLLNSGDATYVLIRSGPQARALAVMPGLRAGASRPFTVGTRLGLPRREALWASARADDAGLAFVRYGSDTIGRWTVEDAASLRALVASELGSAQAYDRDHDSELVRTVQTWL